MNETDTFWTEDLSRSRDYDSPFTAVNNVLNRCGPYHQIDWDRQDALVTEILDKIHDHGFKIVRDPERPEMFDSRDGISKE